MYIKKKVLFDCTLDDNESPLSQINRQDDYIYVSDKLILVRLNKNNEIIYSLYCECISERSLLTERGSQLVNSYASSTNTTSDQMTENTQTCQNVQNETQIKNGIENRMYIPETGEYSMNYTYDIPQWIVDAQDYIVNDYMTTETCPFSSY